MRIREAKDFLVQQAAEQASIEGIPLSDLEKRMMYFTESDDSCEDPIELNNRFEARYDVAEYEKKISRLMDRAYRRIKKGNSDNLRLWNDAYRTLRKGDHYILLLWTHSSSAKSPRTWPVYVLGTLGVFAFLMLWRFVFGNVKRGGPAPIDRYISPLSPAVQHLLQALFVLMLIFAVFPQLSSRLSSLLRRLFRAG